MNKIAKKYLEIDPYKLVENGFHQDRAMVSESLFALANEYCGVRAFFDEKYSGKKLIGTYFNGIYDYALKDTPNAYLGIVKRTHFTINSVNFFKCDIRCLGRSLDLNKEKFENFKRILDMRNGLYTRSFTWLLDDRKIDFEFTRILDMVNCHNAIQKIKIKASCDTELDIDLMLDSNILQWGSDCYFNRELEFEEGGLTGLSATTLTTFERIVSIMTTNNKANSVSLNDREVINHYRLHLKAGEEQELVRYVCNIVSKDGKASLEEMKGQCIAEVTKLANTGFEKVLKVNETFYQNVYNTSDIIIDGSDIDQQGIRYCIFQLASTYHGYEKDNNIGAKGLTGEAYSGHAFWDSETYCLPFYLFSNQEAAKNLLMFRYNTLEEAKKRAIDLDCIGACYPIATRNGKEGCNLWQHASLQFQPSTGVVYAIWHYMNLYHDHSFMQDYGLEMIIEVCKFLLSRGQFNQDHTKFGFYSVMGPDEFQMMVNHNTYTNFMAKKCFTFLKELINSHEYDFEGLMRKCEIDDKWLTLMDEANEKMVILYDDKTKLFEQHSGFYDLPHIDINSIKNEEFPLYSHWSYDRIYRNDIIKQPDVLMFMFLYNQDFSFEQKKANYEYYEPKTLHESSLSPSIHSIFACELGKIDDAIKYFDFATRLDLDDYNNNTCEGIHMTSIAAAWMNIVYGFAGLRSDKEILVLNPIDNPKWKYYSFKIKYLDSILNIKVSKDELVIKNDGKPVKLKIYHQDYLVNELISIKR